MTPAPAMLLQVRGLSVSLGGEDILRDVDLDVGCRTIHAIVGPNGAGKTTLMRSLLGSVAHRGEIRFRFRKNGRIGYVPQFVQFDRRLPMTVGEFLAVLFARRPVFIRVSPEVRSRTQELSRVDRSRRCRGPSDGEPLGG